MKEDRETTIMEQQERISKAALNTFFTESALFGERDEDYLKYLQENESTGKLKTWEVNFLKIQKRGNKKVKGEIYGLFCA